MKYILEVDSRTDLTQSAEHKHKLFVEFLNGLGGFWGLKNDAIPFPGFGNDTSAIIQIEKFLSLGIDFTLFYTYRNLLEDHSFYDDRIYIKFNPKKVDLIDFTDNIIPQFIKEFDAYRAVLYDEKFVFIDFEKSRGINYRQSILRFLPTCYYDNLLCARALNRTGKEVKERLESRINVSDFYNGIYFNNCNSFPKISEAEFFDKLVKDELSSM